MRFSAREKTGDIHLSPVFSLFCGFCYALGMKTIRIITDKDFGAQFPEPSSYQNQLDPGEVADGFEVRWVTLSDAINILESEARVEDHEGKFMRLRDVTLLKELAPK